MTDIWETFVEAGKCDKALSPSKCRGDSLNTKSEQLQSWGKLEWDQHMLSTKI